MLYQALLGAVPARHEQDRAALAVHCTMLEHGFVCTGAEESAAGAPSVVAGPDGCATLQVVPPGWNAQPDTYTFGYVHPLRGGDQTFTVKALTMSGNLMVHAASSVPSGELLTVSLAVDAATAETDPAAVVARAKMWQEKMAAGVCVRLLGMHNSTSRLGKVLDAAAAEPGTGEARAGSGTKRPAPEFERPRPMRDLMPDAEDPRGLPRGLRDPFSPGFVGGPALPPGFWMPDGGLLGPRHPAWGQVIPGRTGGGMMPRFDPIGPGMGEPDPDHLRVPGFMPDSFPAFQGGATGRGTGRLDPDGMFML